MKLVTQFKLARLNEYELRALLRHAFNELAKSNPDTHQRRNTLASIENIWMEIGLRP